MSNCNNSKSNDRTSLETTLIVPPAAPATEQSSAQSYSNSLWANVAMVDSTQPHLVLSDLGIPQFFGYDTITVAPRAFDFVNFVGIVFRVLLYKNQGSPCRFVQWSPDRCSVDIQPRQ